jgi:RimJ/RimL family protein N-acetyltransferase
MRITLQRTYQIELKMPPPSMDVRPITLELPGGVVRLEPLRATHAADLLVSGADPSVWTFMAERPTNREEMLGYIARALELERAGQEIPFAVIELATGRAIGSTRYEDINRKHRNLEIGWTWYGVPWQRSAVNTQCKYLLLRHAFEVLCAVRVQLKCDVRNHRSRAAIERIGATYEGTLRKNRILPDGYIRDSAYYSVVADDWPTVKVHLETLMLPCNNARPSCGT